MEDKGRTNLPGNGGTLSTVNNATPAPRNSGRRPGRVSLIAWTALFALSAAILTRIAWRQYSTLEDAPPAPDDSFIVAGVNTNPPAGSAAEAALAPAADYSASNFVTLTLGSERPTDGLRHLASEPDGRTVIAEVDGVSCRHLNRVPEGKQFGYVYFAIHPTFKARELTAATLEVEYRVPRRSFLRLQYDGMNGETRKPYKSTTPIDAGAVAFGATASFGMVPATNEWQTARFRVTDGAFMNSQNGGADFRFEVTPPEIFVRRVTVTREAIQPLP